MNESGSLKGGRGTWDGLKVGEVAGEGSGPLPHVCTAPGSWGGGGELSRLLICHNRGQTFSWDPQIRDYTGNRDSGTAPRPGATFGGSALNLVHKPNFWCNIPIVCGNPVATQ